MGKAVTYYIIALIVILGLTYMASQAESCSKKNTTSIHANELSADRVAEKIADLEEEEDFEEPMDEHNDASGKISSDEDADDEDVIPFEGDEEDLAELESTDEEDFKAANSAANSQTEGDYLVIAGAFKNKANAQTEVDRLKISGYPKAEIVEFDFSEYYSVCVAKYKTSDDAEVVANSLKSSSGKRAYVHRKRDKK